MDDDKQVEQFEMNAIAVEQLGLGAQAFVKSAIGKYLFERATNDLMEASSELLDINPTDSNRIAAAQVKANTARNFKVWVSEAIDEGVVAGIELDGIVNRENEQF